MGPSREDRHECYVAKARAELAVLAGCGVLMAGNAFSLILLVKGEPTAEEAQSSIDLYGARCEVMLGIPKGDTHDWENTTVTFWGRTWHTIGPVIMGIEANVPTMWHKKIRAARDE